MNDEARENQTQEKRPTAPSVTLQRIEEVILGEFYIRGGGYYLRVKPEGDANSDHLRTLDLLTICVLVLKNGFTVTGESACVSPENFNEQKGREIARQKAVQQIWALEGYLLKDQLHNSACHEAMGFQGITAAEVVEEASKMIDVPADMAIIGKGPAGVIG